MTRFWPRSGHLSPAMEVRHRSWLQTKASWHLSADGRCQTTLDDSLPSRRTFAFPIDVVAPSLEAAPAWITPPD